MPYPTQLPYDLLSATVSDDLRTLTMRFSKASAARRHSVADVNRAFHELRDPRTRLGYDILLITAVATPQHIDTLVAALSAPVLGPQSLSISPVWLPRTLAGQPQPAEIAPQLPEVRPVQPRPVEKFERQTDYVPPIIFDR